MAIEKSKSERRIALVIWRNVIAAVIILSLVVVRQAIIQNTINNGLDISHYVNISGRQRMLSQKISKEVFILSATEPELYPDVKDELLKDLDEWETAYLYLTAKDPNNNHAFELSESVIQKLKDNYIYQTTIHDAANKVIALYEKQSPESEYQSYLEEIFKAEKEYILGIEDVVLLIEQDGKARNDEIHRLEFILFYVLVASVLIQIILVFLPGQRNLYQNYEKVQYLGDHDRLTGLLNQFAFNQRIEEDLRTKQRDTQISLILIDIDGYTKLKEKHGLLVSDDILRRTAATLLGSLKNTDYAARLSNDDFAIILHVTGKTDIESYSKSLLQKVSDSNMPVVGTISACLGIAQYHKPEPLIACLERAQTALDQAKREGRNRIVFETSIKIEKQGLVEWTDDWNSGHEEIDRQHRELVQLGSELIQSSLPNGDRSLEGELLRKIETDLINHFVFEEKILREIKYPETSAHSIIHEKLMTKLQEIMLSYNNEQLNAGYVFSFIVDEIILGHVEQEDSKYFPYIGKMNQ